MRERGGSSPSLGTKLFRKKQLQNTCDSFRKARSRALAFFLPKNPKHSLATKIKLRYKKIMYLVILLSLAMNWCFSSIKIEGGRLATEEELNSSGTVAIVYESEGVESSRCTGVRVAPKLVLTAAHCVFHPFKFPKGVRAALNPLDQSVAVEKVVALKFPFQDFYFRKNFKEGYLLDVAILILEESSSDFYPLISRPQASDIFLQLGYGLDYHSPTKDIFPLAILSNGVLDSTDITDFYNFTLKNHASSVRSGDSGGPVLIRHERNYKLAGVLSSGNPRPLQDIKSGRAIYMNAYSFIDWIRHQTGYNDFNSQFENLSEQFPRETKELITESNYLQIHQRLCRDLKSKIQVEWSLSEKGTCLPLSENVCQSMRRGEIGSVYYSVSWNSRTQRCEE